MTTIESAYARFAKERFPLPTEQQLADLEQRIGIRFAEDYREFILKFNGGYFKRPEITPVGEGCPPATLDIMYGIGASHREAELAQPVDLTLFDDNDPLKILPIGTTGMGGLIIIDTAPGDGNGAIYFKQEFGDFHYLVDGIEAFFALLREPTWG